MSATCIFCKIVAGAIPCTKVHETALTLAFMDINPIAKSHVLVVPKCHAQFAHDVPTESMADVGRVLRDVSLAVFKANGGQQYNILQNNGPLAHQEVTHVHFHIIPKESTDSGLGIQWPALRSLPEGGEKFAQLERMAQAIREHLPKE